MSARRPQPYQPRMSLLWWVKRPGYLRYMLRELTCIWIAAYIGVVIVGLYRLGQGPEAWEGFREALSSAPGVAFQVVALLFVLYHTVTWFQLAPRTMPIYRDGRRVSDRWIQAAHYATWILVSALILILAGG